MTALRRRMLEDLQRRGCPKTQQCSVAAVQQLARHYGRSPDQLGEAELRQYFLFLLNEKKVAESTLRMHLYGIRFFYERTLKRPWPVFDLVRPWSTQKLPVVLSPREVRPLLALVEHPNARMCLRMIYVCRLRLREGTQLQVTDIDLNACWSGSVRAKGAKTAMYHWQTGPCSCYASTGSTCGLASGCSPPGTGRCLCPPPLSKRRSKRWCARAASQGGLHSYPAALLCDPSLGAGWRGGSFRNG